MKFNFMTFDTETTPIGIIAKVKCTNCDKEYDLFLSQIKENDDGVICIHCNKNIKNFNFTEYTGKQKYLLGAIYTGIGEEVLFCNTPLDLIKAFISIDNIIFYAHNLSYDIRFILEYLLTNYHLEIMNSQSRIIACKVYDKEILNYLYMNKKTGNRNIKGKKKDDYLLFELRDSYALLDSSLKSLTKEFNVEHQKGEIDIMNFDKENPEHLNYLRNDCIGLYEVLCKFGEKFDSTELKYSISSQAYSKWKEFYDYKKVFLKEEHYEKIKESYAGGRVEVFNRYLKRSDSVGYLYDVKSLYPSVMQNNLYPIGHASRGTDIDNLGIYKCRVKNDLFIPLLPTRYNGKLVFPNGEFTGWYTNKELQYAEKLGYSIEVLDGYYWRDSDYIFKDYVDNYYKLKEEAERNGDKVLYNISKKLLNSLYGKFGQKHVRNEIIQMSDEELMEKVEAGAVLEYFDELNGYILEEKYRYIRNYAVQISSFVTSYGRIKLYDIINSIRDKQNLFYCDTDSVITTEILDTGRHLGDLELKDTMIEGIFLSPKLYTYITKEYDKVVIHGKGFDLSKLSFSDFKSCLIENKPIKSVAIRPTGIGMARRRGFDYTSCYILERIMRTSYDKRVNTENYGTKPLVINRK